MTDGTTSPKRDETMNVPWNQNLCKNNRLFLAEFFVHSIVSKFLGKEMTQIQNQLTLLSHVFLIYEKEIEIITLQTEKALK